MEERLLFSVHEVAKILHSSPSYIYKLIDKGYLPSIKLISFLKLILFNFNNSVIINSPYEAIHPHDKVWFRRKLSPNTFNSVPQSHKQCHITLPLDAVRPGIRDNTNNLPKRLPVKSIKLASDVRYFYKHPQDLVLPDRKCLPNTMTSLPHSHLHFQRALPSLVFSALSITVNLPNFYPNISINVFVAIYLFSILNKKIIV